MPPVYIRESPSFGDRYGYAFFWSISVVTGAGWDIIPATGVEVSGLQVQHVQTVL
jgi:hypothetical protein